MDKKVLAGLIAAGVVVLAIVALVASSLHRLDSFEIGLKYDTIWKKLGDDALREGLHPGPPGYQFLKFPSILKTIEFDTTCLNKDGVPIDLQVSYQYRAQPVNLKEIITKFKDHEGYLSVLNFAGKTATKEACSLYNTTQFQTERGAFQESVGQKLVERYSELFCDVSEIQVSNIQRPPSYESAIQSKEAAREYIQVAQNERPRKITQAETIRREAETQAEITIQKAYSEARIINNRAKTQAMAILEQYEKEADVYVQIMDPNKLGFTKEGFLSYMGVRAIANAKNPVHVGLDSPAKTSYV